MSFIKLTSTQGDGDLYIRPSRIVSKHTAGTTTKLNMDYDHAEYVDEPVEQIDIIIAVFNAGEQS